MQSGATMADTDPLDYTSRYNTKLSSQQEQQFQNWIMEQSKIPHGGKTRDVSKDLYDYDLRGDWLQGANRDERGHGTDFFKKPNHPTFSTGSKYHGVNGNEGGQWGKQPDGSWTFTPGKTNLENFSVDEMREYFKQVEPGNKLIVPDKTN
jgi:hypothetical protein